MKILVIVHQFPPKRMGGTEVYALNLAKALAGFGHEVAVFHTEPDPERADYELTRGTYAGLPVFRVVHNHLFQDFRRTYEDEAMEAHLCTVLDEVRPDVAHVQHLHLHSTGYVAILKARGIPIVYTLAEFLNICPRNGWLAKPDFALCEGPEPRECAKCARIWPPPAPDEEAQSQERRPSAVARAAQGARQSLAGALAPKGGGARPRWSLARFLRKRRRALAARLTPRPLSPARPGAVRPRYSLWRFVRKLRARLALLLEPLPEAAQPWPRYSLGRFLGKLRRRLASALAPPAGALPDGSPDPYLAAVQRRWRATKAALDRVDVLIAPSRFLREQFIKSGMVAPERIVYSDYGFDRSPFAGGHAPARAPGAALRVGFIGQIKDAKGVHVLVEAFNELPEDGVECTIWGDLGSAPEYVRAMWQSRRHIGVRFAGRYDNDRVAEVLRSIDVLVVPSIWFENSPLTIHEAFLAGVPVITGSRGGMAELVEHDKSGLHFEIGNAVDLRRQIQRLMNEPGLLERLRQGIPPVKDIAEDAREVEGRFRALLGARKAPRRR